MPKQVRRLKLYIQRTAKKAIKNLFEKSRVNFLMLKKALAR